MRRFVAQMAILAVTVIALPALADDGQIAKLIISKLQHQKQAANLKGFDLGVQVDKGTVTMMGQVASTEQAMLALDLARRTPGVKLVVNDLYVNQKAPVHPAPVALTTAAAPTAQPVAYQQPVMAAIPTYHATGAVGSAAMPQPRPSMVQTPVAFAPSSTIRQASAMRNVTNANYVDGGEVVGSYAGDVVAGGGGAYGGPGFDNPSMPGYAWPSYSAHPNYGSVAYPQQYSASAWPYIGPFHPYPQVPLGWRKVSLEWDDGWWFLDFTSK